ncbi:FAD-binding domain-containing protein, partial [Aspergillus steynii IBT 23096]
AIQALRQALPQDQVIEQGTDEFHKLNASYLSALQSDITPACIVRPSSKEQIVAFLRTIRPFIDRGEAAFAIRGAGQQPAPGCSNIQDGITLDLGLLTGIEIKDGSVSIAAGERWGAVYENLDAAGLGVTGARSSRGGIGGLALQGGLSFFSSREGFICDNVLNYEIVLASGEVVQANAHENSDLWIALRGGANNFGVITRYDMRTFLQGPFWGGSVYYFASSFPDQIDALVSEVQKPDATKETHLMISIGYHFGETMCQNQVYYTQSAEKPAVLEPFTAIQPQVDQLNSMRLQTLKEAASEQASVAMDQLRCAYMNITVKADVPTLQAASDIYTAALEPIKPLEGLICSLTLQPYPVSLLKKSAARGGNSLGLDAANGPVVSVLLLTYWKNRSDDKKILDTMRVALENIEKDAESRGQSVPFRFMNYAFPFQDPVASYGAENKQRLQDVSRKYDPEGVFQKGVPGGFKLFT